MCIERRQIGVAAPAAPHRDHHHQIDRLRALDRSSIILLRRLLLLGSGSGGALASQSSPVKPTAAALGLAYLPALRSISRRSRSSREIAPADPLRVLLQVLENPFGLPAAADVMANDRVKHAAPIGSCRRLPRGRSVRSARCVSAAAAVEAVTADRRAAAAAALRRSPHTKPQSKTLSMLPSSRIAGSSV